MAVKICIIGAAGRMGKNIAEAVYNNENADAAGAVDRKGSDDLGQNLYETAGWGFGGPVFCVVFVLCLFFLFFIV